MLLDLAGAGAGGGMAAGLVQFAGARIQKASTLSWISWTLIIASPKRIWLWSEKGGWMLKAYQGRLR